jgi:hypothetical protein
VIIYFIGAVADIKSSNNASFAERLPNFSDDLWSSEKLVVESFAL